MSKAHILQALTQLSPAERLAVIEEALPQLRQELLRVLPSEEARRQAARSAV